MPALVAVSLTAFSGYAALLAVAPAWAVEGGANEAGAGLVNGVLLAATVVTQLFVPRLLRRFGTTPVLVATLSSCSASPRRRTRCRTPWDRSSRGRPCAAWASASSPCWAARSSRTSCLGSGAVRPSASTGWPGRTHGGAAAGERRGGRPVRVRLGLRRRGAAARRRALGGHPRPTCGRHALRLGDRGRRAAPDRPGHGAERAAAHPRLLCRHHGGRRGHDLRPAARLRRPLAAAALLLVGLLDVTPFSAGRSAAWRDRRGAEGFVAPMLLLCAVGVAPVARWPWSATSTGCRSPARWRSASPGARRITLSSPPRCPSTDPHGQRGLEHRLRRRPATGAVVRARRGLRSAPRWRRRRVLSVLLIARVTRRVARVPATIRRPRPARPPPALPRASSGTSATSSSTGSRSRRSRPRWARPRRGGSWPPTTSTSWPGTTCRTPGARGSRRRSPLSARTPSGPSTRWPTGRTSPRRWSARCRARSTWSASCTRRRCRCGG